MMWMNTILGFLMQNEGETSPFLGTPTPHSNCTTQYINMTSGFTHADAYYQDEWKHDSTISMTAILKCVPAIWLFGRCIWNAAQIPCVWGAEYVGFTRWARYRKLSSINGHWIYSIIFFLFGTMMTSGMFANCFLYNTKGVAELIALLIDGTLTSCIAFTFGLTALVDMGVLEDDSPTLKKAMLGGYLSLFAGYVYAAKAKAPMGFLILYVGVILLCCGGYVVVQFLIIIKSGNKEGATWLSYAGMTGGIGLAAVIMGDTFLCETIPLFNGEAIWYGLSVVSMYCISRYFEATHRPPPPQAEVSDVPLTPMPGASPVRYAPVAQVASPLPSKAAV